MASNPKFMVFHLKELIYTAVFVLLGILLIFLLIFMFFPKNSDKKSSSDDSLYTAGVYTSTITLNSSPMEIKVVVDEDHINSISLENVSEAITTMYPLVEPAFDDLSSQIVSGQSLENLTYDTGSQYTYVVLLDGIKNTIEKAKN